MRARCRFIPQRFLSKKNKVNAGDIPAIREAQEKHPCLLQMLTDLYDSCMVDTQLRHWAPHFAKLLNAQRRNAVIYEMALASLEYEQESDPKIKDALLEQILAYNEEDFAIAKSMFFDVNPVGETGVKSCMFPYHEIKRLIHNLRNPDHPDTDIICSGIEALGWLWL